MTKTLQYIFKLIINAVVFLLMLFCLKYIAFQTFKGYYFKNLISKKIENVDVEIFGHSQSLMGLDENYLNQNSELNFENFSILGMPLYYTCSIIQNIINENDRMKIVIELGSNNIDEKGSIKNIFSEESFNYFSQSFFYLINDNSAKYLNQNLFHYLVFGSLSSPFMYFIGSKRTKSEIVLAYENYAKTKQSIEEEWKNPFNENLEIDRLYSLIKKNPTTDFLIIRIPERKKNLTIYNNESKYKNVIKDLLTFKNVKVKDYVNLEFENSSFRDFNHLSGEGMDIFTRIFLKDNFK
jgi:hypothetical protein